MLSSETVIPRRYLRDGYDVEALRIMLSDVEGKMFSDKALTQALALSKVFHYLAAMKLLGQTVPKLEEISSMLNELLNAKS